MKYINGKVIPISKAISAICYRTGCRIQLKTEGTILTAIVTNNKELPETKQEDLVEEVYITAPIEENNHGGIGIQHTGSIGASATLLTNLEVKWK